MIVGFNCSCLDLLNAGHVTMFKMEKQQCDHLIVALQVDPTRDRPEHKQVPVESLYERYVKLQAIRYVDEILVYETEADLLHLLMTQTVHIRFVSDEYLGRDFTGKDYCLDKGITLVYHERKHPYSSTNLRQRTMDAECRRLGLSNPIEKTW